MKKPHQEPTTRFVATNNRTAIFVLVLHSTLTVEKLRHSWKTDLKGLRLSEESRLSWLQYCRDQRLFFLPEDQRFWNALQHADEMEQCYPNDPECQAERVVRKYFQEKCPEEFGWIPAAETFFFVLGSIRDAARVELKRLSNEYCVLWEQGKALWGKKDRTEEEEQCIENGRNGLLAVVQGGRIQEPWVSQVIWELQYQVIAPDSPKEGKAEAKALLEQIGKALSQIGSGREGIDGEGKKAIIAGCKKWQPVCEGLNKAFNGKNGLRKNPEYHSSALYQKEARGTLADKYGISVKEVETIENVLKQLSRRANKTTPTDATIHMVALNHVDRDEKTIETIWFDYKRAHPEWRRKKRKTSPPPLSEELPSAIACITRHPILGC